MFSTVFREARQAAVPMLTGSTADDWSIMPPSGGRTTSRRPRDGNWALITSG